MKGIDKKNLRAYGDTLNDGKVQLSFSLPIEKGPEGREAARRFAAKMGMENIDVASMQTAGNGLTFFVLYGSCVHSVDALDINIPKVDTPVMSFYEINDYIRKNIGHKVVVVGACTGSDAHTVGLDAIMNMKGYAGEYGLERYPEIEAWNLGSQVTNEELIKFAVEKKADAVLISQIVTQKDVHIKNLTQFIELLEAEEIRDQFLTIVGGPRISHELALELGFDAGFGTGSLPPDVASYIIQNME